jgi:hypothetical protein
LDTAGEGPGLAELRIENKRLVAFLKRTTVLEEEQNAAVEQKAAATQHITELVQDKKEIDESLKYVRDAAKEKKKLLEAEEKEFPMASRAVQAVIKQDYLKNPNGVNQAAHRGGNLTGLSVRNLMSKANLIFGGIKEYLLLKTLVQEAKIIDRCDRTATCLTLFDGLFSSVYKTTEQVHKDFEGAMAEPRDFSTKVVASWRSLGLSVMLKAHIAEDHVCDQIWDYKGIGDYNEEFVECLHQEGIHTNQ